MIIGRAALTDWGLTHVTVNPADACLDVGCGGGRTVQKLAAIAVAGRVCGIDYSEASVRASRRTNADAIVAGGVTIALASVAALPYPDRTFDVVTAVETHYYWPDPVADLREIVRVLKAGGRLCLIAEIYKGESFDMLLQPVMKLLGARYLTVDEHRALLAAAGFAEIAIDTERRKGWICAVGKKP